MADFFGYVPCIVSPCCYWIDYPAAKDGQVSVFHCEKVASRSLERSDMEGDGNGKRNEQIILLRI